MFWKKKRKVEPSGSLKDILDPIRNYPILDINGIPTVITEDHHEVFPFWFTSKMREATLLHIDAHDDIWDGVPLPDFKTHNGEQFEITKKVSQYTNRIGIANFICPAIHLGVVDSAYWLNPLADENEQLVDFGTTYESFRRDLSTIENDCLGVKHILFTNPFWDPKTEMRTLNLDYISQEFISVSKDKPFILDIDLDAFCCGPRPSDVGRHVDTVNGYRRRIKDTCKFISKLKRPDLITITRSQTTGAKTDTAYVDIPYVPRDKVDQVQLTLWAHLKYIYT